MNLDEKQLAGKPKKVGVRHGKQVMALATKGGLHLIVAPKKNGAGFETLGTGPHPGVAKFIAKRRAPEVEWTELAKSDHVEEAHMQHILPKYEALTTALRRRHGDE